MGSRCAFFFQGTPLRVKAICCKLCKTGNVEQTKKCRNHMQMTPFPLQLAFMCSPPFTVPAASDISDNWRLTQLEQSLCPKHYVNTIPASQPLILCTSESHIRNWSSAGDIHGGVFSRSVSIIGAAMLKTFLFIIGKWLCISVALFQSIDAGKRFTTLVTFTHSHSHWYTDGRGCQAWCQLLIRSNWEFTILDTSTCQQPSDY